MDKISIEDVSENLIAESNLEMGFLEFERLYNSYRDNFASDRDAIWVTWFLIKAFHRVRDHSLRMKSKLKNVNGSESCIKAKESIDAVVSQRLKSMQDNGELMTKKVRDKYKRIIEMLCVGSVYDFEMAMRTEFPNFSGDSAHRKYGKDGDK